MKKEDYLSLLKDIETHNRLYYEQAAPLLSDYEYDLLLKKCEEIEKKHPEWVVEESPTQRVGETLTKGFKQVSHAVPMLSLTNTYSEKEVADFIQRVHKLLEKNEVPFCAELKMDGVAISVKYVQGKFVRALTRGDGKKGDDVTQNLKACQRLPLILTGNVPEVLEIRGEVYMTHPIFAKLNEQQELAGKEPWVNPRNAAAGSLKLLDPKEVARRHLSVLFYGFAEDAPVSSQYDVHQYLKELGLPSFSSEFYQRCQTKEEIMHFAHLIETKRKTLSHDIDGIVIKVDQLSWHSKLGMTGKSPRWAIAYKFAPEQAKTRIQTITVQVGRTGVLTPVAELTPVFLAGSTIARATLHNQEEIERKDIRIGDTVILEKGGDVIPKVVSVCLEKRPADTVLWKMPTHCPACGSEVVKNPGEVAIRCVNLSCPEQFVRRVTYFASRDAMDIAHLGEKVVEQLVEKGYVKKLSDLYTLTSDQLLSLEGFKDKSVQNLLSSLERSRSVTLARFIIALGIRYIGEETAEALASYAKDIQALTKVTYEELIQSEGIGGKVAQAVIEYFKDPDHQKEIALFLSLGIHPKYTPPSEEKKNHPFFGKMFVLTGTLQEMTRHEATLRIKECGGKVSSSLTQKTDYLIAGSDPGSKLTKAHQLNVQVLDEITFKTILDTKVINP